jgi:hypothetical protein
LAKKVFVSPDDALTNYQSRLRVVTKRDERFAEADAGVYHPSLDEEVRWLKENDFYDEDIFEKVR